VGGQRPVDHARLLLDAGEHLGTAGHLWHPLGRDEAAHLDVAQAGCSQVVAQAHLVGHADRLFLVLQAIARADFDQADVLRQVHRVLSRFVGGPQASSSSTSTAPSPTISPSPQYSALTVPVWGARMLCSIFMASSTTRAVPASTAWPGSTSTRTILPFIGAVSPPWWAWLASTS